MWVCFKEFCDDQAGATSIEYALIASLVFMAIMATVGQVGTNLTSAFQKVVDMGWSAP